jgi:hypothetical protein
MGFWFSEDLFARLTLQKCGGGYGKPSEDAESEVNKMRLRTGKHGEEDAIANEAMGRRVMETGTGPNSRRDRRKIEYAGGWRSRG